MNGALDLYQQLLDGDRVSLEKIYELCKNNEPESLFLDFKRNAEGGVEVAEVTDKSKELLSKALSGFANTAGGVLVWGIDSKDKKANTVKPIPNINYFVQRLNTLMSTRTAPMVMGVQTAYVTESNSEAGYAVTYIPPSEFAPHQCLLTKKYFSRVSSNTEAMEHRQIEAMFALTARPQLEVEVGNPFYYLGSFQRQLVCFPLFVKNTGRHPAKQIRIAVGKNSALSVSTYDRDTTIINDSYVTVGDKQISATVSPLPLHDVLYPGMSAQTLNLIYNPRHLNQIKDVNVTIVGYCEGFTSEPLIVEYLEHQIYNAVEHHWYKDLER